MPTLASRANETLVRALLLGDSGSGKTGALSSLALAGYNLYIADFDNGLDILANVVRKSDPASLDFIQYETFRDKFTVQGPKVLPLQAESWQKGIAWIEKVAKQATPDDVIIVDSLSFASKAAMNFILKLNNRLALHPHQSDYGESMKLIEGLVAALTDPAIKTNIIMTAHIAYQGNEENGEPVRGFPATIGKALSPIIPRYFNHALMCRAVGSGAAITRKIHTSSMGNVELKNVNPGVIKNDYPLATGLADYFRDARGTEPNAAKAA